MPTLVATAGSGSANSFATLAQFESYCDERLNAATTFSATAEDDQIRALCEATRELTLLTYLGRRVDTTQALEWPRYSAINPDKPYLTWYGASEIPDRIVDATCEYALQFLMAGTTDLASYDTTRNVKRERVDVIETEYTDAYQRPQGLRRFPRVYALVAPLLVGVSGNVVPVMRG